MYLSFNHNLKVMKNTTYIETCIEFDAVTYILTITKGYYSLYDEKNRVLFKKGCFIEPQNQPFRLKKFFFFFGGGGRLQTYHGIVDYDHRIPMAFYNQGWPRSQRKALMRMVETITWPRVSKISLLNSVAVD